MDWKRLVYYVPSSLLFSAHVRGIIDTASIVFVQLLTLHRATYKEKTRKVLLGIEHDDKFSLDTPRAILARQAAKFILDADRSIVDSFCQKLTDAVQNIIDRVKATNYKSFGTTQERLWGRFSDVRSSALMVLWNELWLSLGDGTFCNDPLLMQHYSDVLSKWGIFILLKH